jgi:hypothetical protein
MHMADVNPRTIRRHLLLEPYLALLAVVLGYVGSLVIQAWGIDHLGWFSYRCNDMVRGRLTSCAAPAATDGWAWAGAGAGLVLWLGIRRLISRAS